MFSRSSSQARTEIGTQGKKTKGYEKNIYIKSRVIEILIIYLYIWRYFQYQLNFKLPKTSIDVNSVYNFDSK